MGAVLGVMNEDVIVVKLLGEPAFVAKRACRLEADIQATGIFFGSHYCCQEAFNA